MDAWYLLYSKPRQERKALDNLIRQGYEAYLPMVRVRRRAAGRPRHAIEPMFPRYLMVRLSDEDDDWGPIRSTLGVSGLVRFGGAAARVPDELICALQARAGGGAVQALPEPAIETGERVRILDGVLAGQEAIYQARTGKERVIVLLEIAQQVARLTLNRTAVEPVQAHWRRP